MAGLVVGAIGLVVSAAALIIAVWQIRKTQTAAESSAAAAREAREVVQRVTSVSDLSQITVEMDILRDLHRNEEWTRAIDRYSSLERSLTRARATLPEESHGKLNTAIVRLQRMEKTLNNSLDRNLPISVSALNNALVDLRQSLDEVRVELETHLSATSDAGGQ